MLAYNCACNNGNEGVTNYPSGYCTVEFYLKREAGI